jgi:hypothetical protein
MVVGDEKPTGGVMTRMPMTVASRWFLHRELVGGLIAMQVQSRRLPIAMDDDLQSSGSVLGIHE